MKKRRDYSPRRHEVHEEKQNIFLVYASLIHISSGAGFAT